MAAEEMSIHGTADQSARWAMDGRDEGAARNGRLDFVGFAVRGSMPPRRKHRFENRNVGVLYLRPRKGRELVR